MVIGSRLSELEEYNDLSLCVKFLKKEYVKDLLDGNIFMNNFDFFINLERQTKVKGQGDKLETSHVIRSNNLKIISTETNEIIATAPFAEMTEKYNGMEKLPLFCFTHFRAKDFIVTNIKDNIITAKIDLPASEVRIFEESFGDTAILLSNEFKNKVIESSKENETRLAFGDVIYQNYNFYDSTRGEEFQNGSVDILFWKDEYFKYQREARFVLIDKPVDENFVLKIGSIKDKSKVLSIKEFFGSMELEFPALGWHESVDSDYQKY